MSARLACLSSSYRAFLSLAQFWRTRERLCMNRVRSLLSMRGMLFLRARLRPSVYRKTDARTRKNRFDEREQEWVVQKFGLQRLQQRFDAIQAEAPFHLLTQEDGGRLCSQGEKKDAWERLCKIRTLLSMRGMVLGYSLGLIAEHLIQQARLWPSVYQIAGTGPRINLFDKRLISSEVCAAVTSKVRRNSGRASFSPPHSKRQKEEALLAGWSYLCYKKFFFFFWPKPVVPCFYLVIVFLASFPMLRTV